MSHDNYDHVGYSPTPLHNVQRDPRKKPVQKAYPKKDDKVVRLQDYENGPLDLATGKRDLVLKKFQLIPPGTRGVVHNIEGTLMHVQWDLKGHGPQTYDLDTANSQVGLLR